MGEGRGRGNGHGYPSIPMGTVDIIAYPLISIHIYMDTHKYAWISIDHDWIYPVDMCGCVCDIGAELSSGRHV